MLSIALSIVIGAFTAPARAQKTNEKVLLTVVGNSPQGLVCYGASGPDLCTNVKQYILNHPEARFSSSVGPLQIGTSADGPVCSGPGGPGPCANVKQYLKDHPEASNVNPANYPTVIGEGPQGQICTGPLGPGLCTDVIGYLRQHPEAIGKLLTSQLTPIGDGPQGKLCMGPLGPGLCTDIQQYLQKNSHGSGQPIDLQASTQPLETQLEVIGTSPQGQICSGPLGAGPCSAVLEYLQQHPANPSQPLAAPPLYRPLDFSATGSQAEQIGIECAQKSQGDIDTFVSCAGQQVVLPENQQMMVDCAARSGGTTAGFVECLGGSLVENQLSPEQQIAIECISEAGGQPYAAAGCTATRLTARELAKCATNGIGGPNGCFGDNNDLVGGNGWTVRSFNNVVSDIEHGPGPNNDLVGQNGFLPIAARNAEHDIQNGPGNNNDVLGCNGWMNTKIFQGHC